MDSQPTVSVIIPHYNDLGGLGVCLAALEMQTFARDAFEIVVSDNASPIEEQKIADVIAGRARLVITPEKGAGPARNGGVAAARGRILAFIDSDCVAEPEWLSEGVAALAKYDFVGGRVKVLVDDPENITPVEAFERVFAFDFKSYIEKKGFTGSGNLFCPREIFERVGGFRAKVSEDLEWSHRARAAGYRLGYAPNAVIGHPARRSWQDLETKWRRLQSERYHLVAAQKGWRLRWFARACLFPVSAVLHTPRVLMSSELHSAKQRVAALRVLYRLRFWRFSNSMRMLFQ